MSTTLIPPGQWAQNEFGFAQLGDQRRNKRLVSIAKHLAASPGGTLPQAFPEWAELKAAYRFFGQRGVSFERVLSPHVERTRQSCRHPGEYLLIEDTTLLDYSGHGSAAGLGVIGDGGGRGFELHSSLAVRVEAWSLEQRPEGTVMGLFHQECRAPRPIAPDETRAERLSRWRKSQQWAAGIKQAGRPPEGSRWIYVADRESDIYEVIEGCQQHGVDLVIRACQDRRLAEDAGRLKQAVAAAAVLGRTTVELRARAGQPARTAIVEVRTVRVNLDGTWRPGRRRAPLPDVGVVEIRENPAPEGVKEPLHWTLLTSLACATWAQAQQVVGYYTARWWIEEYHKALKSGVRVEESQLERADRLESLIAVLAVVAVRLLNTKMLARSRPESFEAASGFGPQMLAILENKLGPPKGGWTNRNVIRYVARIGGFIGRKGDGEPGWQTIWRGWQRLMWMCEGVNLMEDLKRCG
jgi:hypothetical protein